MEIKTYPIYMTPFERDILVTLIQKDIHKIPEVWKQLEVNIGQKYPTYVIFMTPFEQGFVMAQIQKDRSKIPEIWKQLMDSRNKFLKDAGVETTDLGDSIKMRDKDGTTIIRKKYDWEK